MSQVGLQLSEAQKQRIRRGRKPVMVEISGPGDTPVTLTKSQATKARKAIREGQPCRMMIGKGQLGNGVRPLGRGQDGGRSLSRQILRATPPGQIVDHLLTLSGRGEGGSVVGSVKHGVQTVSKEVKDLAKEILQSGQDVDQIIRETVAKLKKGISGSGQEGGFITALLMALPQALGIVKQVQEYAKKLPQNEQARKEVDELYKRYGAGVSGGALYRKYGIPKKVHDSVTGSGLSGGNRRPTDLELFWSSFLTTFTNPVRGIKFLYGLASDEIGKAQGGSRIHRLPIDIYNASQALWCQTNKEQCKKTGYNKIGSDFKATRRYPGRGVSGGCGDCDCGSGLRTLGEGTRGGSAKKKRQEAIVGWEQAGSGVRIL